MIVKKAEVKKVRKVRKMRKEGEGENEKRKKQCRTHTVARNGLEEEQT